MGKGRFVEILVVIFVIWVLVSWLKGSSGGSSGTSSPRTTSRSRSPEPRTKQQPPDTYRPSSRSATKPIDFGTGGTRQGSAPRADDLRDINDAFTGRRLDLAQPIFECGNCHVFYQEASMAVLREANASKCMACGSSQLRRHGKGDSNAGARNHTPDAITLTNYRDYIGQVVTFTGYVHEVKQSRRGVDYAVMFEAKSWTKGLKMVAFRGGVRNLGGGAKLKSYAGKTLTIRGLLINDKTFGPEIIVDDSAMILRVS